MKTTLTLSMSSFSILNPLTSLSRDRIFALISTKITVEYWVKKKKNNKSNQKTNSWAVILHGTINFCFYLQKIIVFKN